MPLTKEQFTTLRSKGLSVDQIISFEKGETPATKKETTGNQFEVVTNASTGLGENYNPEKAKTITNLIGGGTLAEGFGKAIAAPGVQRGLSEAEQFLSNTELVLTKQINQAKNDGKDSTRLEKALKELKGTQFIVRDAQNDFIESLPSNKEVLGSALQLGTTAAGGAISKFGLRAAAFGKTVNLTGGALRGGAAGAISGAMAGGLYGTAEGLKSEKNLGGIFKSATVGAGLGAALGAPLGAVSGGIAGAMRAKEITAKTFAEDFASPKLTTKEKVEAIRQGRFTDPSLLNKAEVEYSRRDKQVADAIRDIVSPKNSLKQNVNSLKTAVSETNNNVGTYIKENKVSFNTNQLRSQLTKAKDELKLVFASDTTAENTYNKVAKAFIEHVSQKDTEGLFDARQTFDQIPAVKKLLQSEALGENTRKEVVLAIRRAANEYIASILPKGNPYIEAMKKEHLILEALGNAAEKNATIIGKNQLQVLVQQYPILKWLVGLGAAGVAGAVGGRLFGGALGVGGAITGSSD